MYILHVREGPLIRALFAIRTTFGFGLTHPPTLQFAHRREINAHAFNILKSYGDHQTYKDKRPFCGGA